MMDKELNAEINFLDLETERFVAERISSLLILNNISERKMSLELGFARNYINEITNGKKLPKLGSFLAICKYLGITPKDFFDKEIKDPYRLTATMELMKQLDEEDRELIEAIAQRMLKDKK